MAAKTGGSSFVEPLHPPCPKSPPKYPDLYGKRREKAKVQMLEREASFLEEELKSVEGFQPASIYCKEVADFVMANSDPFMPPKNRKSCGFWQWLCGLPCFNLACFCCCCNAGCSCYLKCPECCDGNLCGCYLCGPTDCRSSNSMSWNCCSSSDEESCRCSSCLSCCPAPKWRCCSCPKPRCCGNMSCSRNCCSFGIPSCANWCCCRWKCCSCLECTKVCNCCSCTKSCCIPWC
ncbi:Arabidopsis G protein gamma subunit 3 [Hibiscus trionum]|uniref:Arabidopsis G protein gamma subunit 3 n=1 Tax=Hibiscus trionum TaxID=183268 RepID=A0A9W7J357_HIBTR|nr:Arabidopsis G protein gamma subunit 3 [Hibiscus trionum]